MVKCACSAGHRPVVVYLTPCSEGGGGGGGGVICGCASSPALSNKPFPLINDFLPFHNEHDGLTNHLQMLKGIATSFGMPQQSVRRWDTRL